METTLISTTKLVPNEGQIKGLPQNPRFIRDEKFEKLVQSIRDLPEMLHLRECIVFPFKQLFIVIAGNMRLRACEEVGLEQIPCKVLPKDTPVEKLREIAIKDNLGYGEHDWDLIHNEWDEVELEHWGMDLLPFEEGEEEEPEGTGGGDQKLVIEFTDLADFEAVKGEVKAILEMYPGAKLKG